MAIYFFLRYHVQLPENILNVCFFQFYPDVDEHLPDRVLARLIIIWKNTIVSSHSRENNVNMCNRVEHPSSKKERGSWMNMASFRILNWPHDKKRPIAVQWHQEDHICRLWTSLKVWPKCLSNLEGYDQFGSIIHNLPISIYILDLKTMPWKMYPWLEDYAVENCS